MYPSLSINYEFIPPHLGKEFLEVYAGIKNERLEAKRNKQKIKNETLKLAINGDLKRLFFTNSPIHQGIDDLYEPKSVKNWNVNTEVTKENNKSFAPYSVETETTNDVE